MNIQKKSGENTEEVDKSNKINNENIEPLINEQNNNEQINENMTEDMAIEMAYYESQLLALLNDTQN